MKINKNLIILLLLLIFCISISTVSATDSVDIQINDCEVNNLNLGYVGDSSQIDVEINNLQVGEGSFKELQGDIDDAVEGATINLTKNYKFSTNDDDSIMITKTLTIDGQGCTIDGSNLVRAFNVSANNVIIKNINFINCVDESGGAIYWFGDEGIVSACNFTDCFANLDGGAINWYKKSNGIVSDCNFNNCNSLIGGAIIWFGDEGIVSDCNFTGCNALSGGAIYWATDDGNMSGCNFTDCSADSDGGAICCYGSNSCVSACSFDYCYANFGGAIDWFGDVGSVSACSFTGCNAQSGGAIYWAFYDEGVNGCSFVDCSTVGGCVSTCSFVDCSAKYGGAILWFGDYGSVNDCCFTNCNADLTGGAIDWNDGINGSVNGCNFIDCSASFGENICIDHASLSISNCTSNYNVKASIYNDGIILSDIVITTLNEDVKDVNYGESINLTGTVTTCGLSVAGQKLTFNVNGNQITADSDDYGIYSASYTVDFVDEMYVDATYEGSTGPETVNMGKLISSKSDVIVTVVDVKGKTGEKVKLIAKVNDIYGNPVQGGVVIFGFNGKEYKANVENGIATVEVVLPKAGNYSATAYYVADKNHNDNSTVFTVNVIDDSNPGIPMEHTGTPLVALLIALISLPIIRRK